MKSTNDEKKYSVYVHRCPDGMVYVGMTSMKPERRWLKGNGYTKSVFYEAVKRYGWDNIYHKTVMSGLDKFTASELERVLMIITKPELSYNIKDNGAKETERFGLWSKALGDNKDIVEGFLSGELYAPLGDSVNMDVVSESLPLWEKINAFGTNSTNLFMIGNSKEVESYSQKQYDMKKEKVKAKIAKFKVIKGVKIEEVLDTRYEHKGGGYPVCIRLYKDRKYKYFPTEYVMTVSDFLDMNLKDEEHIHKMFDYYCDRVRDCGINISCSDIQRIPEYSQTSTASTGGTMEELFNEKISLCGSVGTATGYRETLKKINAAFPKGLKLTDISVDTVNRFVTYMTDIGLNSTTINIHLTKLKACLNYGIYKGYVKESQYPFKRTAVEIDKITLPKGRKRDTEYITKDEMRMIWDWFMHSRKVNRRVGMFLFSYLHGGINVADMVHLKFNDFYFREGGFCYKRRKTMHKNDFNVIVPVTKWTEALFERMGIVPTAGNYVFRELSFDGTDKDYMRVKQTASAQINRVIHKVSGELGISGVSMTTARHTFATVATKNRMPWTMVEQAMGHANNTVSGHYIGGFSVEEMRVDFENLL